ncbi:MAG: GntR family transcriptional regulator [Eubacteriales bacterium]|jgi:GntR family transcriptional regulator
MQWEFYGDRPIYLQIMENLRIAVAARQFTAGQRLPSVRELAAEAGVNPNTMQKALTELEREGLVYSQRTSGRFITEDVEMVEAIQEKLAQQQIQQFFESMSRIGFDVRQTVEAVQKAGEEQTQ